MFLKKTAQSSRRQTVEEEDQYDNFQCSEQESYYEEESWKNLSSLINRSNASVLKNELLLTVTEITRTIQGSSDEDDTLSYFQKLAEEMDHERVNLRKKFLGIIISEGSLDPFFYEYNLMLSPF